jgi:hypothetical protein
MRAIKSRSLLLAACRLMLVARSLMLAACCLNRLVLDACCLRLEAWCLWLAARNLHTLQSLWCYIDGGPLYPLSQLMARALNFLVLAICYILNFLIPALLDNHRRRCLDLERGTSCRLSPPWMYGARILQRAGQPLASRT